MSSDRDPSAGRLPSSPTPWELLLATVLAFVPVVSGGYIFVPDDVYFYLKISRQLVEGNGSTFNGLLPTNGYHPLWMLVCVLERAIAGPDPHALIRLHLAVSGLFNLAGILLAHCLARQLGLRGFVAAGAVAWYLAYNFLGSEIHVSVPLLLIAALLLARGGLDSGRNLLTLGGVLGLTMLARLDNVFVAGALALCATWVPGPRDVRGFVRRALLVGLPAAAVVAPYLAWNWLSFGHWVPISGAIKSGLAAETLHPRLGLQATVLMLGAVASLGAAWWSAAGAGRSAWLALAAGALMHSGYVVLGMENVWTWYFSSELVASALLAEAAALWIASRILPLARWPETAFRLAGLLALLLVAWSHLAELRRGGERWFMEMAGWLDENLPPGAAIAATFSPGSIAYFSEHPVLALDGLTGDFAFHERAAELGLAATLEELGVQYLYAFGPRSPEVTRVARETERRGHAGEGVAFHATALDSGDYDLHSISVVSPMLGRKLGRICLGPDWLVGGGFPGLRLSIWKLPPDGGCGSGSGPAG